MKDIYVQFRGKYKVDGESRDSEHKDWLEVNSWAHNMRQPKSATSSSVGGHTAERVEHSDMLFIKDFSVHDKFHRALVLSGFFFLKIASTFLNSSFFPKPIKRRIAI